MIAKDYAWRDEELALSDVRERPDFQVRADGVDRRHVRVLERTLEAGGALEPVKVARIGKARYLVDGFHRKAAHKGAGRGTINAKVARMSLEEARAYALLANTRHGKSLKPKDKARMFELYVKQGQHLGPHGSPKSSRDIAAELNNVYSHETVRKKLKGLGVDLDEDVEFPGGYQPMRDPGAEEEALALERLQEARECLEDFAALCLSLEEVARRELLEAARKALGSLERGERPQVALRVEPGLLDI